MHFSCGYILKSDARSHPMQAAAEIKMPNSTNNKNEIISQTLQLGMHERHKKALGADNKQRNGNGANN
jgi:hypothetical protein